MKKSFVISSSIALLVVVAAMSTLAVLSAFAGQKHGQDCAQLAQSANPSLCGR